MVKDLITLTEKARKILEKLVNEIRLKENVYGIGLFGSWSRGDASPSSDIDLLLVERDNSNYEFVERTEVGGLLIDLDYIPKSWFHDFIPPEIDQKLYEMHVLYDRDWTLNNTKLLMNKLYSSPERVDIRIEAHMVDADIYFSRATSAFSRGDFRSACLFGVLAVENILRVLLEIALQPFSVSSFLERLEVSTSKLGMETLYKEYLRLANANNVESALVKEKLRLFKVLWNEMKSAVAYHNEAFALLHPHIKSTLNYYLNTAFLQGAVMRANSLLENAKAVEAAHYLNTIFLNIIENYAWFKSSAAKTKIDYSTLLTSLERLEKNPKTYINITKFLGLEETTKHNAAETLEKARGIIFKVRKERKVLIKNHLITK